MNPTDFTIDELVQGYRQIRKIYSCNYCSATFFKQEQINNHLAEQHNGALSALLSVPEKYNTLTQNQQQLLTVFKQPIKDSDIAKQLQVSPSTIRHQKFTFREKAKQAQLYLAQYQAVFGSDQDAELLPIPPTIVTADDRFKITNQEYQKLTQRYFDYHDHQLHLIRLPKGQKRIVTLLYRISDEFDFNINYTQPEIDQRLKAIYPDYDIIKRYLVDYGFLARTTDNRRYWRTF